MKKIGQIRRKMGRKLQADYKNTFEVNTITENTWLRFTRRKKHCKKTHTYYP
jgi:hypothetical protein